MKHRKHARKLLDPIHIANLESIDGLTPVAQYGRLLNASATGLLIGVRHDALSPDLRDARLSLADIEGVHVKMNIVEMNLDMDGKIARTHCTEQGEVEIAVDFRQQAPAYWRECLAELLPSQGEMEQPGTSWTVEL